MDNSKVRVQIIGNYLEPLEKMLNDRNITVDSIITKCNPLAMVGKGDKSYMDYAEKKDTKMLSVLNIRKNLDQMLSRDPRSFCQNYNVQPLGKEVRYKNETSYLIVSNSGIVLNLYEKKGVLFSVSWPEDDFIRAVKNDKTYTELRFPFPREFNVMYYYDKFIDIVLNEYDKDHIILIKTNSAQWYMSGDDIAAFDKRSSEVRSYLNAMDEYFIQATHCLVINEEFNNIPHEKVPCAVPYVQKSNLVFERIAEKISDIICGNRNKYLARIFSWKNSLAESLSKKLSLAVINSNRENMQFVEDNWLSFRDIKSLEPQFRNAFFANILKLEKFLAPNVDYTLTDYVLEKMNSGNYIFDDNDLDIAELYAEFMKSDINDLIAFYMISKNCNKAILLKRLVEKICQNPDCIPVQAAIALKKANVEFLKNYPYINANLDTDNSSAVYIQLKKGIYLVLDPNSETPVRKIKIEFCEAPDHKRIIEDGYVCSILEAEALTYCIDYYVEKAKNNCGGNPTFLKFETFNEFECSLNYIDYKSLLENEAFVFEIADSKCCDIESYSAITDLTELMDKDLVTVRVNDGLGDQFGYYVLGRLIEEYSNRKVLYDNLSCRGFNGFEVHKFAKKHMNVLSAKLSKRLIHDISYESFNKIYKKISNDYTVITWDYDYRYKRFSSGSPCFLTSNIHQAVTTVLPYSYYHFWLSINNAKTQFNFKLRDYIEFPEFVEEEHKALCKKMLSCDSVVIHIRLGDYISVGWATDNSYYVDKIRKVMSLKQYNNKKFFIFSDDIRWCKEHKKEIGLDQVGECEIIFVEGNKYENSFRDIQLMSLGKIMIVGTSYFSRIAALYSNTWEMFFSSEERICRQFEEYVRKNKYDINTGEENK